MRAASAARWAEDELFSLKNAFDLQLKRLEVNQETKTNKSAAFVKLSGRGMPD